MRSQATSISSRRDFGRCSSSLFLGKTSEGQCAPVRADFDRFTGLEWTPSHLLARPCGPLLSANSFRRFPIDSIRPSTASSRAGQAGVPVSRAGTSSSSATIHRVHSRENILFGFKFRRGFTGEYAMKDCQQLLAEYAMNGSDAAFRELVGRYINFVYSTALRLVGGDSQLAEDVTQTVFINLATKGRALSSGVMLGGWLH